MPVVEYCPEIFCMTPIKENREIKTNPSLYRCYRCALSKDALICYWSERALKFHFILTISFDKCRTNSFGINTLNSGSSPNGVVVLQQHQYFYNFYKKKNICKKFYKKLLYKNFIKNFKKIVLRKKLKKTFAKNFTKKTFCVKVF